MIGEAKFEGDLPLYYLLIAAGDWKFSSSSTGLRNPMDD